MKRPAPRLLAAAAAGTAAAAWLGLTVGAGAAITLVAALLLLCLVARYDNHTGSCVMLSVLILLVIGVLCMLIALLVVVGTR